ncbi:MAG: hypothetical protein COA80_11910 [Leeuwenhoekiella sp.]|nr:MAG: hypothetical protein COA80_11910 [Leeuwenhoekiella sp.]
MNKSFIHFLVLFSQMLLAQDRHKPNVLFILADDLGINALNCYGNPLVESPNIDKLFNEGMHFTNGYSNDPTCAPSRASILSGQYVPRHKVYRVTDRYKNDPETLRNMRFLPPPINSVKGSGKGMSLDKVTIAEALKQAGYLTASFGKWHLGKNELLPQNQGFDVGYEITGHYNFKTTPHQEGVDHSAYSSDFITQQTLSFINQSVEQNKPFFAYVPYYLVHKPLEPKPEYLSYFKSKYKTEDLGVDEIKVLAMIKSLDENVGQLLNGLKTLGIEENTIVLFVSDNGHYRTEGNLFTKPYRGSKGETLEGGIRVPYIFKWPGQIKPSSSSAQPIIHVDLYPTILGLTGVNTAQNYILDGEDFTPILDGSSQKSLRDALIWEYTNYARWSERSETFASSWVNVIQMDGYKMTEDIETGRYTLYNLNTDPYEQNNIVSEFPAKLKQLQQRLERWKNETSYEKPLRNPAYDKR